MAFFDLHTVECLSEQSNAVTWISYCVVQITERGLLFYVHMIKYYKRRIETKYLDLAAFSYEPKTIGLQMVFF